MKKIGQCAVIAAFTIGALLFATRPAQAQNIAGGGVGDHLFFGYWTTEDDRATYLSINSPFGVRDNLDSLRGNVVRVIVRNGGTPGFSTTADSGQAPVGDDFVANNAADPEAEAQFNICLMPGDTWTAALTANPAGDGSMLTLGSPGSCDAMVPQPGRTIIPGPVMATPTMANPTIMLDGLMMGTVEAYPMPEMRLTGDMAASSSPSSISGFGYMVSVAEGFASTYNALALSGCGGGSGGCPHEAIVNWVLQGQDQQMLLGRWITAPIIAATTDVILTFPSRHPLNYQVTVNEAQVIRTDPLSIYVFNEDGGLIFWNNALMLDQTVNMCSFDLMEGSMTMTQLMCNGEPVGNPFSGIAGSFRIFNNVNKVYSGGDAQMAGTEMTGISAAAQQSGQPGGARAGHPVIGFVLSAFDVTSGMYDMMTPIRWSTNRNP